jgi:hypothetical protein
MRHDVGIGAKRDARVAMAESRRDRLDRGAGGKVKRRIAVTEIMKSRPRNSRSGDALFEGSAHVARRERCPNTRREYEASFLPMRRTQFTLRLPNFVFLHNRNQITRQFYRAERRLALWSLDDRFAPGITSACLTVSRPASRSRSCHRSPSSSPRRSPVASASTHSAWWVSLSAASRKRRASLAFQTVRSSGVHFGGVTLGRGPVELRCLSPVYHYPGRTSSG